MYSAQFAKILDVLIILVLACFRTAKSGGRLNHNWSRVILSAGNIDEDVLDGHSCKLSSRGFISGKYP
jgi:hypothetical protein